MTRRNKNYFSRKRAFQSMSRFTDLKSFLIAGFKTSRSLVVKKDILSMLRELERPGLRRYATAS